MSEMVERVARAMCGSDNPDFIARGHKKKRWEWMVPHARAALTAMREPPQRLQDAAQWDFADEDLVYWWNKLIDEALK